MTWVSLEDFVDAAENQTDGRPRWAHGSAAPAAFLRDERLRGPLEDGLDVLVALQRAEWLETGIVLGPKAWPDAYDDLVSASDRLGLSAPTAIVGPCRYRDQHTLGTTRRATLQVSAIFLKTAKPAERRFLFGRLAGHIAADQVTFSTIHAMLAESTGLRRLARSLAGPIADLALTPVSVATRLAMASWHRDASVTADRAGLIASGDPLAARTAILREALGVQADIDIPAYLDRVASHEGPRVGRWSELWADRPWLHRRLQALDLFEQSDCWSAMSGAIVGDPLDDDALAKATTALMEVR